jgi:hypothetical protein
MYVAKASTDALTRRVSPRPPFASRSPQTRISPICSRSASRGSVRPCVPTVWRWGSYHKGVARRCAHQSTALSRADAHTAHAQLHTHTHNRPRTQLLSCSRAARTLPLARCAADVAQATELLLNLGEVLQWEGREAAANASFAIGVARGVWQHPQQRPSHWVSGLRAQPWWDLREHPVVRKLLQPRALATLREEGVSLLRRQSGTPSRGAGGAGGAADGASGIGGVGAAAAFQPYYSAALAAGTWSDVTLALSGARQPGAAHAPRSYALYASLGEEATTMVMGSAYFSVLTPGAQLRRHCGPTNLRLRVHIGLRVADGAAMRVGDETRAWASGAALAFDDSFEHEVWNASPEPRLVFIVDVWHPQLTTDEQRLAALDEVGRQRYRRTVLALRNGHGLPEEHDLVAERRVRTVY